MRADPAAGGPVIAARRAELVAVISKADADNHVCGLESDGTAPLRPLGLADLNPGTLTKAVSFIACPTEARKVRAPSGVTKEAPT